MKCCFCSKHLPDNGMVHEIRGGLGNKVLAYLCQDCYNKLYKLKHHENIIEDKKE